MKQKNQMSKRYIYKKKIYIFLAYLIDFLGFLLYRPFSFLRKQPAGMAVEKILVIEFAHIGDVLAITPALNILRKKFPESLITVAVAPWAKDILAGNPDVDEIMVYETPWFERSKRPGFSFGQARNFIRILRSKKFDMAIDLRGDIRNIFFMKLSGARKRIGYSFSGAGFLLTDIMEFDVEKRQDKHQVEHNINFVLSIKEGNTCEPVSPALKLFLSKEDRDYADSIFKSENIKSGDFLIAVHPGAGTATKRWMPERFSSLIEEILKKYKAKILLVGGKGEADLLKLPAADGDLINLTGKTSIKQLAAILDRCNLFIGGDSGVMHIAEAQNIPVIAIWGGQNKPGHWKPLSKGAVVIHKEVYCSPCGLIECKTLKCLGAISVEDILGIVDEHIRNLPGYKDLIK
ncbi:MAG: glycosyltransferase family 9 protein [Candidatus Omnitrophica bacterium]|nr:glycosyltransferase family 9 protein [Candidatus Omnitrophota bacterium]